MSLGLSRFSSCKREFFLATQFKLNVEMNLFIYYISVLGIGLSQSWVQATDGIWLFIGPLWIDQKDWSKSLNGASVQDTPVPV